ncbi:MAG: HipA domain-containing protein [Candidatus Kapabacteria bacterium]|jgi:serine/threonine-protein kinase HipA|nr:HipA domain-containing protein [Candidatus Kapabacteria bacterium]
MKTDRCLFCFEQTTNTNLHESCSKKFYGTPVPPVLDYAIADMYDLATNVIGERVSVPGVQTKISMGINNDDKRQSRLTIIGLWGEFILKPPGSEYPFMPENESLTMKLAEYFGIQTVPNSLIHLKSGELAYITKRIDRAGKTKFPMEDMAQLTGRLTEQKYRGSLEQIGKTIARYSSNPGYDLLNFFELNLFSFLTGNADMHLKNFSIIHKNNMYSLAPAYDLLSTRLLIPEDKDNEESALSMNGKKRKFNREDFLRFSTSLGLAPKAVENTMSTFSKKLKNADRIISNSFLEAESQVLYLELMLDRASRIGI